MSKTIKDLAYFQEEVAKKYGYTSWEMMSSMPAMVTTVIGKLPSELTEEAAEAYAQYKAEQAYQRGRSEGYNKGYSDGLNAEELKF